MSTSAESMRMNCGGRGAGGRMVTGLALPDTAAGAAETTAVGEGACGNARTDNAKVTKATAAVLKCILGSEECWMLEWEWEWE